MRQFNFQRFSVPPHARGKGIAKELPYLLTVFRFFPPTQSEVALPSDCVSFFPPTLSEVAFELGTKKYREQQSLRRETF